MWPTQGLHLSLSARCFFWVMTLMKDTFNSLFVSRHCNREPNSYVSDLCVLLESKVHIQFPTTNPTHRGYIKKNAAGGGRKNPNSSWKLTFFCTAHNLCLCEKGISKTPWQAPCFEPLHPFYSYLLPRSLSPHVRPSYRSFLACIDFLGCREFAPTVIPTLKKLNQLAGTTFRI